MPDDTVPVGDEGLQIPVTTTTTDEQGRTVTTGYPPDGTGPVVEASTDPRAGLPPFGWPFN